MSERYEADTLAEPLTPRERDILKLLARDLGSREIAQELTLAHSTVKWYVRQVYEKLGVSNKREALARAAKLGLADPAAALRPPHDLPTPATPFVGREQELAALSALLGDPHTRLVTLFGPGGIGKTRLALAAAERELDRRTRSASGNLVPARTHGVWFVSLASVPSPAQFMPKLVEAHGLWCAEGDHRTDEQRLLDYLRGKRMLLVLDNFEHLREAAPVLAALVGATPDVQFLVTSRERLQLSVEHVFPVSGLALPPGEGATSADVERSPAIQLFMNTARRVQPDLKVTPADLAQMVRICRLTGGMPLCIELASSWVGVLPLSEIQVQLESSLDLLAADLADLPPRHRSMIASLDASWQRLTALQQDAFRRLCVFRSGFTRSAALAVADATLPQLVTLANKAWLTFDPHQDRYHIHELVRQYGLQKLSAHPELASETWRRYSAFFCHWLAARRADFHSAQQMAAVAEIQSQLDDIQAAWERAVERGDFEQIEQGLDSLCSYYQWVGRLREAEAMCRMAADRLAQRLQQEPSPERLALRARILAWQSRFTPLGTTKQELLSESEALVERAAQAGDNADIVRAFLLLRQANLAESNDTRLSIQLYQQALEVNRSVQDQSGTADALDGLSFGKLRLGLFEQAETFARESLEIRQALGDRLGEADALGQLALILKHQGKEQAAEKLQRQALGMFRELGHHALEMEAAGNLANTLWWLGNFDETYKFAEYAISIQQDYGLGSNPFYTITKSRALLHLGRYQESLANLDLALQSAHSAGAWDMVPFIRLVRGQIATVQGRYDEAAEQLGESIEGFASMWPNLVSEGLACQAFLSLKQERFDRAAAEIKQALVRALQLRGYFPVLYCLPAAALLAAHNGDSERALELYEPARGFGHISQSRWFHDVAARELDALAAALPRARAAARKRGQARDLWETAAALEASLLQ